MGRVRDFYSNQKHKHLDSVFMETLLKQGACSEILKMGIEEVAAC